MRFLFLLLLLSCSLPKFTAETSPPEEGGSRSFPRNEVVAALNLLTLINDWPAQTAHLQKEHSISPELSTQLLYPLRPLWKDAVRDTRKEVSTWDRKKIRSLMTCPKACECFFWYEILAEDPRLSKNFSSAELQKMYVVSKDRKLRSNTKCIKQQKLLLPDILSYLKIKMGDYRSQLFLR